ncbi:MAG: hypothetical protein JRH15_09040, partial [Deltaproteobacteria bacterium]|nr:hypothetical protein [Deltaproteobacteria bacterium]
MSKVKLINPRCEYMQNPIGIDIKKPRLSWEIESDTNGTLQTAYQVVVAESQKNLADKQHLVWDTGKVLSNQSIHCEYKGPALESKKRYNWAVRIWDENDHVSDFCPSAFWEMGLLLPRDWEAHWITPDLPRAKKCKFDRGM